MKRLLSAPAFQFKGTGWYVTDYAKKSGSGAGSTGESKDEKATSKSSESSTKKESATSKGKKTD
jgi:predicted nucleic acid-binding Zn ribbon protein